MIAILKFIFVTLLPTHMVPQNSVSYTFIVMSNYLYKNSKTNSMKKIVLGLKKLREMENCHKINYQFSL